MDMHLLLPTPDLVCDEVHCSPTTNTITILASMTTVTAACPRCQTVSTRIHSRYTRTLHDLPWTTYRLCLILHVRRFRCELPTCSQQIFAERLPTIVAPFARRTQRLSTHQTHLGLLCGGVLGATVSHHANCPVSRTTLVRLVHRAPEPPILPPTVVGIDDWAFRKGQTYGTIVVDLVRQTVLDLLPDRTPETVAAWLAQHPSITVVSRDRASAYSEGIRLGAPQAKQVADRWHVMRSVVMALKDLLIQRHHHWHAGLQTVMCVEQPASPPPDPLPDPIPGCPHRRAVRHARYCAVQEAAAAGMGIRAIAATTGISRNTVRRYLRLEALPETTPRARRHRRLDPYLPYLTERLETTPAPATVLLAAIQAQGYSGKLSTLKAWLTAWRRTHHQPAVPALPSLRTIIGWVCQPAATRLPRTQTWLTRLGEADAKSAQAIQLTDQWLTIVRTRDQAAVEDWLAAAAGSGLKPFQSVARGIQQDRLAIGAGLELPWSTGPVEGHINRLKLLKRQMFGRATLALLRKRVRYQPRRHGSDHQERA